VLQREPRLDHPNRVCDETHHRASLRGARQVQVRR
jgi:hypothetical protein